MGRLTPYLRPLRETAWVGLGQVIAFLGGLAGIKLLTNMMPPENYGELALGLSLAGVVNLFFFGPLNQVVQRFYSACRERGDIGGYTRVLIRLHGKAILLLAVLTFPLLLIVGMGFGWSWAWLFALALMFGIFSGVQGTLLALLGALRDRKMAAFTQGLDTWLRLGFAAVLVAWVSSLGQWAILGYTLGSLIIVSIQLWVVRRHGFKNAISVEKGEHDRKLQAEFLAYGLPFLAFAGLGAVSLYADRWLLQAFWSTEAVGIYAAMFQIASAPVAFLMAVTMQLIIPVVFSRSGNLDDVSRTHSGQRLLGRSVLLVGTLYVVVTLLAYVWGGELIIWLTNADYALYASVFWVLVLSHALSNLAQLMTVSGLGLNSPGVYLWPKLGQALGLLVAGFYLVEENGVIGMAKALLFSSMLYFLWVWLINIKLSRSVLLAIQARDNN